MGKNIISEIQKIKKMMGLTIISENWGKGLAELLGVGEKQIAKEISAIERKAIGGFEKSGNRLLDKELSNLTSMIARNVDEALIQSEFKKILGKAEYFTSFFKMLETTAPEVYETISKKVVEKRMKAGGFNIPTKLKTAADVEEWATTIAGPRPEEIPFFRKYGNDLIQGKISATPKPKPKVPTKEPDLSDILSGAEKTTEESAQSIVGFIEKNKGGVFLKKLQLRGFTPQEIANEIIGTIRKTWNESLPKIEEKFSKLSPSEQIRFVNDAANRLKAAANSAGRTDVANGIDKISKSDVSRNLKFLGKLWLYTGIANVGMAVSEPIFSETELSKDDLKSIVKKAIGYGLGGPIGSLKSVYDIFMGDYGTFPKTSTKTPTPTPTPTGSTGGTIDWNRYKVN